jgi:hypothetical protein
MKESSSKGNASLHVHRPHAVTLNKTPEEFHISIGLCQKIQIKFTARGLWTRTLGVIACQGRSFLA